MAQVESQKTAVFVSQIWIEKTWPIQNDPSGLKDGEVVNTRLGRNHRRYFLVGYHAFGRRGARSLAKARAVSKGVKVKWIEQDLDSYDIPENGFDMIAVSYFLNRSLTPKIMDAMKPDSFLFYEQHSSTSSPEVGRHDKYWLLRSNELLQLFGELRIRYFEEGLERQKGSLRSVQRLVAQKQPALYEPLPKWLFARPNLTGESQFHRIDS